MMKRALVCSVCSALSACLSKPVERYQAQVDASVHAPRQIPTAPAPALSTQSIPLARPLHASQDAGNWRKCYDHFEPRGPVNADLIRLGLLCGPSNGMKKLLEVPHASLRLGERKEHHFSARVGDCFRILAVGGDSRRVLAVRVMDDAGKLLRASTGAERWFLIDEDGPFCVDRTQDLSVLVFPGWEADAANGLADAAADFAEYGLAVWRARR